MRRSDVPLRSFAGAPSFAIPSLFFPAYLQPPTSNLCLFIHFRTLSHATERGGRSEDSLATRHSSLATVWYFQSLTTVKYSNPFVLITIRNAGGCTYSPSASDVTHSRNHLPWCSAFVPSALRHACGDSSLPGLLSTLNFRLWTSASPLEATLTSHSQLIENTATLSSLDATLTRFLAVSHLESTLTKKVGGVGLRLPSSPLPVHFKSRATY